MVKGQHVRMCFYAAAERPHQSQTLYESTQCYYSFISVYFTGVPAVLSAAKGRVDCQGVNAGVATLGEMNLQLVAAERPH